MTITKTKIELKFKQEWGKMNTIMEKISLILILNI